MDAGFRFGPALSQWIAGRDMGFLSHNREAYVSVLHGRLHRSRLKAGQVAQACAATTHTVPSGVEPPHWSRLTT
jgi:hypothetical protein